MERWEEALAQAGYRVTVPRRVVAAVLSEADTPCSAQVVFELGKIRYAGLGLVTVYRTLALYESLGLISRVHVHDGCHGYLATTPGHRHALICTRCGRSVEFLGQGDLDLLIARLEKRTGYRVQEHLLQLFGLCSGCRGTDE
ncbi:MAG: transcriptional repressor [Anaerolineae bacterium]|jgi:Fur family ferric uptake transcriptional regulator|nr:transcriptional repressor [Anaerolineae bacterium]